MSDFGDSDMDMGLSATPAPGQGSRRGTPAPGSAADVPPAAKKQKRAVPRFLGDGLSDEEDGRVPQVRALLKSHGCYSFHFTRLTLLQAGSSKGADATAALFDDLDNIFDDDPLPPAIDISAPVDNNATVHQADEDIDTALPETKKRAPRAKLDYERLLGPKGFPKLIEECRNFKLGAKGSEVCALGKDTTLDSLVFL